MKFDEVVLQGINPEPIHYENAIAFPKSKRATDVSNP